MRRFATYFDSHYLPRARALVASLQQHALDEKFEVHALCLDEDCRRKVNALGLPWVAWSLGELENARSALQAPRKERSRIEYYFTLGPTWLDWLLEKNPEWPDITYLDADLYFFAPFKLLYDELKDASVGLVPHRFSPGLEKQALDFGKYNVGWMYFGAQGEGRACLRWWAQACLDWCFDRVEDGKFADQKYLDEFERRFEGVVALKQHGANLAPWNLRGTRLEFGPTGLTADGDPLVFYHFHGLKPLGWGLVDVNLVEYGLGLSSRVRENIYLPYMKSLVAAGWKAPDVDIRITRGPIRLREILKKFLCRQLMWIRS